LPRRFSPARLSRAAAFAGLAGCYTTSNPPPPRYSSPPPVEEPTRQEQPPPPPPPAVVADSRIDGDVKDAVGQPAAYVPVQLQSLDQPPTVPPRGTKTEVTGRYSFVNLPAGRYKLTFGHANPNPHTPTPPPTTMTITLGEHDVKRGDFQVDWPPPKPPQHMPTPYGAPPARRRIV
jgi:hypothetical protein